MPTERASVGLVRSVIGGGNRPMRNDGSMLRPRMPDRPVSPVLDTADFADVVSNAPLVAFDLIVEDTHGAILLGMRNNPPARGYWFVPGGRIRKNETLNDAFARISTEELGFTAERDDCRFVDVHEHMYSTNFLGTEGAGTHYIVLVYRFRTQREALRLPTNQHSHYTWMQPGLLRRHPQVHPHVQAYFPTE